MLETEIKLKVPDHASLRARLPAIGATRAGQVLEVNTFYDTDSASLRNADRGLRIRTTRSLDPAAGTGDSPDNNQTIITYKGPRQAGPFKSREEVELIVDDPAAADVLLTRLGYAPTLSFEKRRESWETPACKIELDELPHLGTFMEIESADESAIRKALADLGLTNQPQVSDSYIALLTRWAETHAPGSRHIRFTP